MTDMRALTDLDSEPLDDVASYTMRWCCWRNFYLSAADICIDPDPSNPFNDRCTMVKMMEYMALGKPIVAFDLPVHRIAAQAAAVYAHPNDEFDFTQRILALMDDPERREKMGQRRLGYR